MSRLTRLGFIDIRRTSDPVRRKVRSRGVPPALTEHEIFYTEDISKAKRLIGRALSPLTLTVDPADADGFAATMHGIRLRNVSMLYLDLHVPASIDIPASGRYYAVHMPMNGVATVHHPSSTFQASTMRSLVSSPGVPLRIDLGVDTPQLLIRIEQQAMAAHVTRLIGRNLARPLVFEPEFDLATEAAMRWHAAVQLVHRLVGRLTQADDQLTQPPPFQPQNLLRDEGLGQAGPAFHDDGDGHAASPAANWRTEAQGSEDGSGR